MNYPTHRLFTKHGNPLPNHPVSELFCEYSLEINSLQEWNRSGCPCNTAIIDGKIVMLSEEDAREQHRDKTEREGKLRIFGGDETTHTYWGQPILSKLKWPLIKYWWKSSREQWKKETEYMWHSRSQSPAWFKMKMRYNNGL